MQELPPKTIIHDYASNSRKNLVDYYAKKNESTNFLQDLNNEHDVLYQSDVDSVTQGSKHSNFLDITKPEIYKDDKISRDLKRLSKCKSQNDNLDTTQNVSVSLSSASNTKNSVPKKCKSPTKFKKSKVPATKNYNSQVSIKTQVFGLISVYSQALECH